MKSSISNPLYYECHITVNPLEGKQLSLFKEICEFWKFKPSKLLFQRDENAKLDQFCTGKDVNLEELEARMNLILFELEINDFDIKRFKIEAIILDSK